MSIKISAVIITKNEEANILRCLHSLSWCHEVIVVDSNSTDQTVSLAQTAGAKVIDQKFLGYGAQKHFATQQASYDWIFSIDADEEVTPELANEILATIQIAPPQQAFHVPRTLFFMGKKLHFSGENKKGVLRLFNRQFFQFNLASVHEEVKGNGEVLSLNNELIHYSYKNWSDYIQKMNHYSEKMAEKLVSENKKLTFPKVAPWSRFLITFFKIYIIKLGFLDGLTGFSWAISSAYAHFLKYSKFLEKIAKVETH